MTSLGTNCALVLGASGGLGSALVTKFLSDSAITSVFAVSSQGQPSAPSNPISPGNKLVWIKTEYDEQSMAGVVDQLKPYAGHFARVCICHGLLHSKTIWPEKRLEDINAEALHEIFQSNTVVPALWLKLLFKVLKGKTPCVVATMSARVGSIGDNRMGGWHSYRASKAALNMVLQNMAIEYARRAKNVKLIAFHPGTTDTGLSKPFQASVPSGKLFAPAFVASQLAEILANAELDGQLSYVDWKGQTISW
ncbi:SDR family NAD(P)-dependent oxidoreductase [Candidatus Njordibacter sp. Uisw_039]|jgi:NAD(P)-dependent dehydrogenase (short-subunit alcohol dehydrogenase family)|uniref:SDR family NAD(P)-dependent oxidoreductase n=1 Tax=Candidatus Njordibacter sp. Uisw_039 TaxID=3230972 RepID=UPI003591B5AD|tara:strand:+ start:42 stop:794 length:753 start_codon:yes stop_codon:yes gene_type:complete